LKILLQKVLKRCETAAEVGITLAFPFLLVHFESTKKSMFSHMMSKDLVQPSQVWNYQRCLDEAGSDLKKRDACVAELMTIEGRIEQQEPLKHIEINVQEKEKTNPPFYLQRGAWKFSSPW